MSTYRYSATAFNVNVAGAYDLAVGEYDALRHGMCSANIAALSHDVSITPLPRMPHASEWSRVNAVMPNWQAHLPETSLGAMAAARTGDIPLPTALATVAQEIGSLERLALTGMSMAVLADMGVASPERVDGSRTSAIEAGIGHATILIRVGDQGALETEYIGLADGSCNDIQQEFIERMRNRGALFDEQVNVQHHDPRGGTLAQDAARVGGRSRAAALVVDGDSKPSALTAALFAPATTTRQRAAEGGR
ncbi:hypothetical protein [Arthrobacter sp. NPDC058127]|uniref:hypothetical protein n=1 Tax=Arthrobacter sp. NPDC058127 TaxID=3346351 RepID=UPI0036E42BE8